MRHLDRAGKVSESPADKKQKPPRPCNAMRLKGGTSPIISPRVFPEPTDQSVGISHRTDSASDVSGVTCLSLWTCRWSVSCLFATVCARHNVIISREKSKDAELDAKMNELDSLSRTVMNALCCPPSSPRFGDAL